MAKEQENEELQLEPLKEIKKKKKGKKKKGKNIFIGLLALIIIVGVAFLNRSIIIKQIAPLVKNVPFLNEMIVVSEDPYDNISRDELILAINTLEVQNANLQTQIQDLEDEKKLLNQRITALGEYEQSYMAFLEDKEAWDEELATKEPDLFIEYYEQMFPEQAQQIYEKLKQGEVLTKDQKAFAIIVGDMDEGAAADALSEVITTDPDLVKLIFNGMSAERQSLILTAMTTENAAQVIKLISPDGNE